ncbi:MAG: HAMP domain-containing protein [Lachnospiraceae bacterium]|nr:HAMP domain-containing protein [Lachnospiraceae bacterium]
MRQSFRRQLTMIFSAVMAGTLFLIFFSGVVFLEKYYIADKQKQVMDAYVKFNTAALEGTLDTEEFQESLQNFSMTDNISVIVMGTDSKVRLYATRDAERLKFQLWNYILDRESVEMTKILKENPNYIIRQSRDRMTDMEYLEMLGNLDNGDYFIMRTPLESIRDSVMLANRFYVGIGAVAIVISAIIIYFFSRKITKPVMELAGISKRMTALDFDAKFESKGENEIDLLGEHMNQLSEALEKTISELKTANNELRRDIEQKEKIDEMRKEFLANVSHELKTPLALIQGYAEGLKDGISEDAESRDFYCEVIMDETKKMNLMVKKLLTLNEVEFGQETVAMERFNVAELIEGLAQSCSLLVEQKGGELRTKVADPLYVWSDELKIEEVLINYISNACNHLDGARIVEIKAEQREDKTRISVFNTGKQIPEEDLERIWEKFYKVDKAHTREYGGSGIGLSIVKAIMESVGGTYGVKNYTNGVEFWIEL